MSIWKFLSDNKQEEKEPGFFDSPKLKKYGAAAKSGLGTFFQNPVKNTVSGTVKGLTSFGDWLLDSGPMQRHRARLDEAKGKSFQPVRELGSGIRAAGDLIYSGGKGLAQEVGADAVWLTKSALDASGIDRSYNPKNPLTRSPEDQAALEKKLFGREADFIGYETAQDLFGDIKTGTSESGSGAFESTFLAGAGTVASVFATSPVGAPAKGPIKTTIKGWLKKEAEEVTKDVIIADIKALNLNMREDVVGELADSIQANLEAGFTKAKTSTNINRLITGVAENEARRAPSAGGFPSVVQVVNTRTGAKTFYEVSPEDLRILSEDLIDGTSRGVAGKQIGDNIYHLTAKTPAQMVEGAGFKNGGKKELDEILDLIKPPAKRVPIRDRVTGRFLGSFIDDDAAYKLAAKDIKAENDLAEQVRQFKDVDQFAEAVTSISDRMRQFGGGDAKVLRSQVSRIEERLYKAITKYTDSDGVQVLKKNGVPEEKILVDFYNRVTDSKYRKIRLSDLAYDKSFEEVSSTLYKIFGRRVPIRDIPASRRGGADVVGKTYMEKNGDTVIGLLRKGENLDQIVANHEGWHWYRRNLSDSKVAELDALQKEYAQANPQRIAELKEEYVQKKGQSDEAYQKVLEEELMADEFANYFRTGNTTWDRVKNFFDEALTGLKMVFGQRTEILARVEREFGNVKKNLKKNEGVATVGQGEAAKVLSAKRVAADEAKPTPKPTRIKIDAELQEIRKAVKDKDMNAEKIGELSTRIDLAEEALPEVGVIKRIAGRNTDDTLQQIQATAMKEKEVHPIAKDMNITEATAILKEQKNHNAKTLEAARIVRRANLDDVVTEQGFNSLDEAQEAIEQFASAREDILALRDSMRVSKSERALANKASKVASTVSAERRSYVNFLQDQFQLSDADIKKITFGRDLQRMGESEFKGFITKMEQRAVQVQNTKQAKNELMALLEDKHFEKVDNYRNVHKFPPISQMNEAQLRQYAKMLEDFAPGDEFLSERTLETISRTKLGNVSTMREVREQLWEELKENPEFKDVKLSDLEGMQATAIDNWRYDTALAEKNPFYNLVVNRTQAEMMRGKASFLKMQTEVNRLTKLANASRNRGVVAKVKQAFVPRQSEIIDYLEATPAAKDAAREALTKEELDLANYMETYYSGALDHLITIQELRGSRYADAYFTHTKKQFLEKWSDDGLINAIKGMFDAQKDAAQVAKIIDQDTGQILAKNKFFKYTLRRTGEGEPSQNATKVFLDYADQMERKKSLDRIIPEIDVYTQALTPKGLTKKGLELDRSLKTFINKYLNNKKGRRENFGGLLEQGGKLDVALRIGNLFVSLKDLGGNVFASAATIVGESVMTYQGLGKVGLATALKRRLWDTGVKSIVDPNAKKILKEAEPFLGRNVWTELMEPNVALTDKALTGIFAPFAQSSVETNKLFLLGKITKEELASGKLSPARLAELRLEAGRWRDMGRDVKSVYGATSGGATMNKYKGWAIPIARTNIDNIKKLLIRLKNMEGKGTISSREFQETYRALEITAAVYLVGNYVLEDNNEDSFAGKLYSRIQLEASTIMGGIDPRTFVTVPRLVTFLEKLVDNMVTLASMERYKTSGRDYEYGDLKGAKYLQRQLTPRLFKQFDIDEEAVAKTNFKKKVFNKIIEMEPTEAAKAVADLSEEDWEMYKSLRTSWRSANTRETRGALQAGEYKDAVEFVRSLPEAEQKRILNLLTDEEYAEFNKGKESIPSPYQQEAVTQ